MDWVENAEENRLFIGAKTIRFNRVDAKHCFLQNVAKALSRWSKSIRCWVESSSFCVP